METERKSATRLFTSIISLINVGYGFVYSKTPESQSVYWKICADLCRDSLTKQIKNLKNYT